MRNIQKSRDLICNHSSSSLQEDDAVLRENDGKTQEWKWEMRETTNEFVRERLCRELGPPCAIK